ncbi:MAG: hypothetical protein QGF07_05820 [Phycisphaerales bacterium]|nr:hypothetical protein [Phycisphaerales bacterium]
MSTRRNNAPPISLFSFQDLMIAVIGIFIIISLLLVLLITKQVDDKFTEALKDIDPAIAKKIIQSKSDIDKLEVELASISEFDQWKLTDDTLEAKGVLIDIDLDLVTLREELEATRRELDRIIMDSELEGDAGIGLELRTIRDNLQEELDEFRMRTQIVYLVSDTEKKKPIILEFSDNQIVIARTNQSLVPWSFGSFEEALVFTEGFPNREDYYLLVVLKPSGMLLWEQLKDYVAELRKNGKTIDIGLDLIAERYSTTNQFIDLQ